MGIMSFVKMLCKLQITNRIVGWLFSFPPQGSYRWGTIKLTGCKRTRTVSSAICVVAAHSCEKNTQKELKLP